MTAPWPIVRLGDVLTRSQESVTLEPDHRYREITVRLWGKGVVQRRALLGAEVATQRRFVARQGQFILSRIDARNGALGIVPAALDGAIVTNDFPLFSVNRQRLLPAYIGWACKAASFVDQCRRASEGTTNRVRLQERKFLEQEIPLPPLAEQRRVVARVEDLARQIYEASDLRRSALAEMGGLWRSLLAEAFAGRLATTRRTGTAKDLLRASVARYSRSDFQGSNNAHPHSPMDFESGPYPLPEGWVWTNLGSVLTHLVDCVNDTPDFAESDSGLLGLKSTNIRPYTLDLSRRWFMRPEDFDRWNRRESPRVGDILLTREAPMGYACVIPPGLRTCLTQRLMLLRPDRETVLTEWLLNYLNSTQFRADVRDRCRGLTTPHIRVQDAPRFLLPLAPLGEQRSIVAKLAALRSQEVHLKRVQTESTVELDALLPAIVDRAFKGELL